MESNILKIFAQVAGIGGLSLGVFFLLFREIIRKNIFASLTKEQSYKVIRLILMITWTVAIFGISVWVFAKRDSHTTIINNYTYYTNDPTLGKSILSMDIVSEKISKRIFEGAETFYNCIGTNSCYAEFMNTSTFNQEVNYYKVDWGDGSAPTETEIWDPEIHLDHLYTQQGNFIISLKAKDISGKIYVKKYNFFNGNNPVASLTTDRPTYNLRVGDTLKFILGNFESNAPWTLYQLSVDDGGGQALIQRHPAPRIVSYIVKKAGNFTATLRVKNPCYEQTTTLNQIRVFQ